MGSKLCKINGIKKIPITNKKSQCKTLASYDE
jgi:hypothetical protein